MISNYSFIHNKNCKCSDKSKKCKSIEIWFIDNDMTNFYNIQHFRNINGVHINSPLTFVQIENIQQYTNSKLNNLSNCIYYFFDFDGTIHISEILHLNKYDLYEVFGNEQRQYTLAKLMDQLLKSNNIFILTKNPAIKHIANLLNFLIQIHLKNNRHYFIENINVIYSHNIPKLTIIDLIVQSYGHKQLTRQTTKY